MEVGKRERVKVRRAEMRTTLEIWTLFKEVKGEWKRKGKQKRREEKVKSQ
jgi:hypothetical protein